LEAQKEEIMLWCRHEHFYREKWLRAELYAKTFWGGWEREHGRPVGFMDMKEASAKLEEELNQ
jgi:hypothetical protein